MVITNRTVWEFFVETQQQYDLQSPPQTKKGINEFNATLTIFRSEEDHVALSICSV
jgi:hypothetical protein